MTGSPLISTSPRILVVGPAWVGDMVMAQSLFITLKQHMPQCHLDVIAPGWSVPLLQRMPQVERAIELPVGHNRLQLLTRYHLGKQLRDHHYDQAIILPRTLKAALIPWFARITRRTGFRGEQRFGLINDMRRLDKQVLRQTVQRYVALGLPASAQAPPTPYPSLRIDPANQHTVLERLHLSLDRPVIGFMPGAEYGPAKQWPLPYYQQLAAQLTQQGRQVWVFGSAKETALGEVICQGNPNVVNLCGKTSLVEAVDLIALTHDNVSNDSGLMHVACATGRPLVAIYGSSDPGYTPPLSAQARVLYLKIECSPCFDRRCRFGHTRCLTEISPQAVQDILNEG